eukprot:3650026-Pleurochrysis_carterae.AAC.1
MQRFTPLPISLSGPLLHAPEAGEARPRASAFILCAFTNVRQFRVGARTSCALARHLAAHWQRAPRRVRHAGASPPPSYAENARKCIFFSLEMASRLSTSDLSP